MGNNAVVRELARLSNTVNQLGLNKSRADYNMANLGLQGARQDYDIDRQKNADIMAGEVHAAGAPGRELKLGRDEKALQDYNAPVTMSDLVSSPQAAEHLLFTREGKGDKSTAGKANIDIFLNDMGFDYDKTPGGAMTILSKATGKRIKKGEFPAEAYTTWIKSNTDTKRRIRGQREDNDDLLQAGKITPEDHAAREAVIFDFENNIPAQIQENKNLIENLSRFKQPWADKRILRIIEKNEALIKEDRATKAAIAAARTKAALKAKDNRGKFQKDAEFLASVVPGLDKEKAAEKLMSDKKAANMVTAFNKAVDGMDPSIKYNPEKKAKEVERLKDVYQIEKFISTDLRPGSVPDKTQKTPSWKDHR